MSKNEVEARRAHILRSTRAIAGIERAEVLGRPGNNALLWRSGGVRSGSQTDRRKEANRRACRDWR